MYCVRVLVGDASDGIFNGTEERDKEGGKGSLSVVTASEATTFDCVMCKEVREGRYVGGKVCDCFEKDCCGIM